MKATKLHLLLAALTAAGEAYAQPAQLTLDLGVPLELTLVPAGSFRQGSPAEETDRRDDEAPRDVTLARAFYLGVVPVTRAQFEVFTASAPYRTESEVGRSGGFGLEGGRLVQSPRYTWRTPGFAQDGAHPAVIVTFDDAQRFLAWASGRAGRRLRLPTEAEWERACRGGTDGPNWQGAHTRALLDPIAWHLSNSGRETHAVGTRLPNPLGLFDMLGNVLEWCADSPRAYSSGPARDPVGEEGVRHRAYRGGSWGFGPKRVRAASRGSFEVDTRIAALGFRLVAA